MGKRKHHDDEEYLARKIRKLETKMLRARRKQRDRSYSGSRCSNLECGSDSDQYPRCSREDPQNEGAPYEIISIDIPTSAPAETLHSTVALSSNLPAIVTDEPPPDPAPNGDIPELEPDILCLLGEEPVPEEEFGENVHKDVASRWSDILVNGLKSEIKTDLIKAYSVPANLKLAQAPALNPEIRAAVNEAAWKRDLILADKQKILATVITSVANTMTFVLNYGSLAEDLKRQSLKYLSDAGRLLCHVHYNETETRKNFLLSCLIKEIKDSVKDLKRDNFLFGSDLQDNLKSMKAIIKTGTELKPVKPKIPSKNLQAKASTSRALNWRGPPPPQPQPRRVPARRSSTAGGRKQSATRRTTDRRAPRQYNRTSRR